jgi:hypothetical protein
MHKLRTVLPTLVALSLVSIPAYGSGQGLLRDDIELVKRVANNAQQKTQAQFKESLERLKRCMHGDCTRAEALKTVRDLSIAVGVVIPATYVTGAGLKKLAEWVYYAGAGAKAVAKKAARPYYKFYIGEEVWVIDGNHKLVGSGYVQSYLGHDFVVDVQVWDELNSEYGATKMGTYPASLLELY